jgi:4a-hydroxytetrahydrobiopterin dehydratase
MSELTKIRCVGCEGGIPSLAAAEIKQFMQELQAWEVSQNNLSISKKFIFKNFYKTMAFVNAIAWMAHQENHHPDMEIGFNYCIVKYTTHAVNGLTKNDFICAAKIDSLGMV